MEHHTADLLAVAEQLARERHAGQTDKAGAAYWTHPQRVSQGCTSDEARIAGWLHDLIEDTGTTAEELLTLGFPPDVVAAVRSSRFRTWPRRTASPRRSSSPIRC